MPPVRLTPPLATLAPQTVTDLAGTLAHHHDLECVLDWCLTQSPPILTPRLVVQDELTHDLIVRSHEGAWVVYDAT